MMDRSKNDAKEDKDSLRNSAIADIKSALEGEYRLLGTTLGEIEEVFLLVVPRVIQIRDDALMFSTL